MLDPELDKSIIDLDFVRSVQLQCGHAKWFLKVKHCHDCRVTEEDRRKSEANDPSAYHLVGSHPDR